MQVSYVGPYFLNDSKSLLLGMWPAVGFPEVWGGESHLRLRWELRGGQTTGPQRRPRSIRASVVGPESAETANYDRTSPRLLSSSSGQASSLLRAEESTDMGETLNSKLGGECSGPV